MSRKAKHGGEEWSRIRREAREQRERAILTRLAEGDTLREAAVATHFSYDRTKDIAEEARLRLGARNRTHAVALAIQQGIIQ